MRDFLPQIAIVLGATFAFGLCAQALLVKAAHRWNLVDIPDQRRRHRKATPIIGGVGVVSTFIFGLILAEIIVPGLLAGHTQSLLVIGGCVLALMILGLIDDLKGLAPVWKLSVEIVVASTVLAFEPEVHALCLAWTEHLGFLVWPIGIIWIVGITNAINLIDGLDGLAGGMSSLVASSILILSLWTGETALMASVTMALLLPSILSFLKFNWFPAKIFLGDNGSLVLGFLIATCSLICRPNSRSWVLLASLILMLGYPILDMGLAVLRRWQKGQPLFKADRNHLHFRLLRLGPGVPQTAALLLSIGLYLQVTALAVNLTSPATAALGIAIVAFSIFSVLYLIRSIERWRVQRLSEQNLKSLDFGEDVGPIAEQCFTIRLELEPLYESALFEEKLRFKKLVIALELLVGTLVRRKDFVHRTDQEIVAVFVEAPKGDREREEILIRFRDKVKELLDLFNFQCSLASIPVRADYVTVLRTENDSVILQLSEGLAGDKKNTGSAA